MINDLLFITRDVAVLFLIAGSGWLVFSILRIPVPTMLGAMTFVIIFRVFSWPIFEPPELLFPFLQIILGLFVGSKFNRKTFRDFKTMVVPALIIIIWVIIGTTGLGYFLSNISNMDFITAFLSSVPGGVAELGVIALAVGATVPTVMFFQVLRVFTSLVLFSLIFSPKNREKGNIQKKVGWLFVKSLMEKGNLQDMVAKNFIKLKEELGSHPWKKLFIGFAIATVGGFTGRYIQFPAGELFGSMIFVMAFGLGGYKVQSPPVAARRVMELGIGAIIGYGFSAEILKETFNLFPYAIIMLVILLGMSYIVALIIKRLTSWDFQVCMIACAPAGLTAMTILADSLDSDPVKVSILHLTRVLTLKLFVMFLISILV